MIFSAFSPVFRGFKITNKLRGRISGFTEVLIPILGSMLVLGFFFIQIHSMLWGVGGILSKKGEGGILPKRLSIIQWNCCPSHGNCFLAFAFSYLTLTPLLESEILCKHARI